MYGTCRLGGYRYLYNWYQQTKGSVSLIDKTICSFTAAIIGSLVGNPADLILIRMQNDLSLPLNERRGYTNVIDAAIKIVK